jgi:hypothetical protein
VAGAGESVTTKQEVTIAIDDTFTGPVCDCCVGFLRLGTKAEYVDGKERRVETAEAAGTGTFVKLHNIYGILTAGHVLQKLGANGSIGLVRFPNIQPPLQNFRLNLAHTERIVWWSEKNGDAPDIGFLKMPMLDGRNLELAGALFYNLGRVRNFTASQPEHRMAKCYAIVGVVGEWTEGSTASTAEGGKVVLGGLFGAAKNLAESEENKTQLVEVEIDYAEGPKIPSSYGGVSGGALWELHVELNKESKTVQVNKRLHGVAFRQSSDHKRITSNAAPAIASLIEAVASAWPKGE